MSYLERMRARIEGREQGVPIWMADKIGLRTFAKSIGVRTPTIFREHRGLQFDFEGLPDEFVLKPVFGSTSLGVFLLQRGKGGRLTNLVTGADITYSEIVEEERRICAFFEQDEADALFIVEELIRGPVGEVPPQDIRFYSFQGEVGLILCEDHMRGSTKAMYFGPGFLPLADLEEKYSIDDRVANIEEICTAVVPLGAVDLLAVARRISVAIPTPFARIDLFDSRSGPVLGEVTLYPGTFYYRNRKIMSSAEDLRLGELWASAETRLRGTVLKKDAIPAWELSVGLAPRKS